MSTPSKKNHTRLARPIQSMPAFVKRALEEAGVMEEYRERPPYQRNDYLWWIKDAKREETKQKRLAQMIDELKKGDVYMNMSWNSRKRRRSD